MPSNVLTHLFFFLIFNDSLLPVDSRMTIRVGEERVVMLIIDTVVENKEGKKKEIKGIDGSCMCHARRSSFISIYCQPTLSVHPSALTPLIHPCIPFEWSCERFFPH